MENYICFTFHLRNRVMLETVRGKFGALLRSLHLRYRSESEFLPYRDLSNPRVRPWRLDFSMLPPEYQQDNHLEILRHLKESYLPRLKAAHPEWGDVAIYRNLHLVSKSDSLNVGLVAMRFSTASRYARAHLCTLSRASSLCRFIVLRV